MLRRRPVKLWLRHWAEMSKRKPTLSAQRGVVRQCSHCSNQHSDIPIDRIRNFSIIAHVDHGKSTLADRIMEFVGAIDSSAGAKNEQVLDKLPVERERGITVKAQTVSFNYDFKYDELTYSLNLIDTPGHVDFNYEVSRSLAACQGVVLLVDANSGVQAQTVANFFLALDRGLVVVPAINKIDLPHARPEEAIAQIESLFGIAKDQVLRISAKHGIGIEDLLDSIVERIPPPTGNSEKPLKALVFDSWYNQFRGTVALVVVLDGRLKSGEKIEFFHSKRRETAQELGVFTPSEKSVDELRVGQVGFVITGVKEAAQVQIGETIFKHGAAVEPVEGFQPATPVVFAGFFPLEKNQFSHLARAMDRLLLNDPSVFAKKDGSNALGGGWMLGFLGVLHMDVFRQRLEQEFDASVVVTAPNVLYKIKRKGKDTEEEDVRSAAEMPDSVELEYVKEPMVKATIIAPSEYSSSIKALCNESRGRELSANIIEGNRTVHQYSLPLNEIVMDFYDCLKALTSGFASFNYEQDEHVESRLVRVDFLVHSKQVDELSVIAHADRARDLGRETCLRLKEVIPRQLFKIAIQAAIGSKIIAREDIREYKKDVTAKLYGGDQSRKQKLLDNQAKSKRKMRLIGKVEVPHDAFVHVLRKA